MSTIVVALPATGEPFVTGAVVVKRDGDTPTVVRTPAGTLHVDFTVL